MGNYQVFTPEEFGAAGDGITNDTGALRQMCAAISIAEGGTAVFRAGSRYLVGQQGFPNNVGVGPSPISLQGCSGKVTLVGNGCTIRCTSGLKYGSFNPATGDPSTSYSTDPSTVASPYAGMIDIQGCTGGIEIDGFDLDGNSQNLIVGAGYSGYAGDSGIQIAAVGILVMDNFCDIVIKDCRTHHHAQDGIEYRVPFTNEATEVAYAVLMTNVRAKYNARQGCSAIGGGKTTLINCAFNHTGKGKFASAPGAGFDIEAEGVNINRALEFLNCEFINNHGVGLAADSGDTAGAIFRGCKFVGTTNYSIWPHKPGFVFEDCLIVGEAVAFHSDPDGRSAPRFLRCRFTNSPKYSPTGGLARCSCRYFTAPLGLLAVASLPLRMPSSR